METEMCTSHSLDKLDFIGVKILLVVFLNKERVKEEFFFSNLDEIKNWKGRTFSKSSFILNLEQFTAVLKSPNNETVRLVT